MALSAAARSTIGSSGEQASVETARAHVTSLSRQRDQAAAAAIAAVEDWQQNTSEQAATNRDLAQNIRETLNIIADDRERARAAQTAASSKAAAKAEKK
jgi:hypothetical protein